MTEAQKNLVTDLLDGMYLLPTINRRGTHVYKLYRGNMNPVRYVKQKTVDNPPIWSVLKRDKKTDRITLNKSKVRQLHGKSFIKKEYKKFKKLHYGTSIN